MCPSTMMLPSRQGTLLVRGEEERYVELRHKAYLSFTTSEINTDTNCFGLERL